MMMMMIMLGEVWRVLPVRLAFFGMNHAPQALKNQFPVSTLTSSKLLKFFIHLFVKASFLNIHIYIYIFNKTINDTCLPLLPPSKMREHNTNANVQMLGECRALLVISGPGGGELRDPEMRTRFDGT